MVPQRARSLLSVSDSLARVKSRCVVCAGWVRTVGNNTSPAQQRGQQLDALARQQQALFRHSKHVERPGIPNPIRLSLYRMPDKPSPPLRGDDKVRAPRRSLRRAALHAPCGSVAPHSSPNPPHNAGGPLCVRAGREHQQQM